MKKVKSINTLEEALEFFLMRGNSIKEKITSPRESIFLSEKINAGLYKRFIKLCKNMLIISRYETYIKISDKSSSLALLVPYCSDLYEWIVFQALEWLTVKNILAVITAIGLVSAIIGYAAIGIYLHNLHLSFLLPNVFEHISSGVFVWGLMMPLLLIMFLIVLFIFCSYLSFELYKLSPVKSLKGVLLAFYIPLLIVGYMPFIIMCLKLYLHVVLGTNVLVLAFLFILPFFQYLYEVEGSRGFFIRFRKGKFFLAFFLNLFFLSYICFLGVLAMSTEGLKNNGYFVSFLLYIFPAFAPFSIILLNNEMVIGSVRPDITNRVLKLILCFSFIATVGVFVWIGFGIFDSVSNTKLGKYYQNLYVTPGLAQYGGIINQLDYDKRNNQIRPWIVLQTDNRIAFSKNKTDKIIYVFNKSPYRLLFIAKKGGAHKK